MQICRIIGPSKVDTKWAIKEFLKKEIFQHDIQKLAILSLTYVKIDVGNIKKTKVSWDYERKEGIIEKIANSVALFALEHIHNFYALSKLNIDFLNPNEVYLEIYY